MFDSSKFVLIKSIHSSYFSIWFNITRPSIKTDVTNHPYSRWSWINFHTYQGHISRMHIAQQIEHSPLKKGSSVPIYVKISFKVATYTIPFFLSSHIYDLVGCQRSLILHFDDHHLYVLQSLSLFWIQQTHPL